VVGAGAVIIVPARDLACIVDAKCTCVDGRGVVKRRLGPLRHRRVLALSRAQLRQH
jgi:hypothetical protein